MMKLFRTKYWYWMWKTFLGPSRLRKKFVRTFLVSGLIPLLFMGAVSAYLVGRVHRIDVAAIQRNIAVQVRQSINETIDSTLASLQLEVAFDQFAPIRFEEQAFILQAILEERPSLTEASIICTTSEFCRVGEETSHVAASARTRSFVDRRETPEFKKASIGEIYTGPVHTSGEENSMILSAPIFNKGNQVIGVVRGEFNLRQIQKTIEDTRLGEKGYVYVVNNEGEVIAHPETSQIGAITKDIPSVDAILSMMVQESPLITEVENFVYRNPNNELVSGAGVFVPELGWGVVAEWPRAETQRLITIILIQIVSFAILTFLIIIVVASRIAYKLIAPIAYLNQSTNIIGSGNFDYRVNIETNDELEDLGENINKMAKRLKGLEELNELKLRAKYLTESLEKEKGFSKLKDQFITTVSHQFNTPLTVINWTLEELQKPGATQKAIEEGLARIAESRKDISDIANDLVTLSEIGFRYQIQKMDSLNLGGLVQKIIKEMEPSFDTKHIPAPTAEIGGDTTLMANSFAIKKVIENLTDNAITYSNDKGVIEVKIEGKEKEVVFSIHDQGIGIPKDDQKSIFQEFFRAKNAVEKKNVGTGLGLFLVKTIVEGHNGKVWFESEEGKGSTFFVSLPKTQPEKKST